VSPFLATVIGFVGLSSLLLSRFLATSRQGERYTLACAVLMWGV
jgi:hypothetical protein